MGKFKLEDAVARYGRTLFAYAYSLLGDYHEAEDAVQEAFAAAMKGANPMAENAYKLQEVKAQIFQSLGL